MHHIRTIYMNQYLTYNIFIYWQKTNGKFKNSIWSTVWHSFNGNDGDHPVPSLVGPGPQHCLSHWEALTVSPKHPRESSRIITIITQNVSQSRPCIPGFSFKEKVFKGCGEGETKAFKSLIYLSFLTSVSNKYFILNCCYWLATSLPRQGGLHRSFGVFFHLQSSAFVFLISHC